MEKCGVFFQVGTRQPIKFLMNFSFRQFFPPYPP